MRSIHFFLILFIVTGLQAQDYQEQPDLQTEESVKTEVDILEEQVSGSLSPETHGAGVVAQTPETNVSGGTHEITSYTQNNDLKKRQSEIQTLAGSHTHNGGFGAISFMGTEFNGRSTMLLGLRGGWIINRVVAIGLEGYGLIPAAEYSGISTVPSIDARAVGGYGGLFIEPILFSNKVVHLTFPVSTGGGWAGYVTDWEDTQNWDESDLIDGDSFWYIKPGVSVEINVALNFRIVLGTSYRFTQDLQLVNTSTDAFQGWNYFLTLKFGCF